MRGMFEGWLTTMLTTALNHYLDDSSSLLYSGEGVARSPRGFEKGSPLPGFEPYGSQLELRFRHDGRVELELGLHWPFKEWARELVTFPGFATELCSEDSDRRYVCTIIPASAIADRQRYAHFNYGEDAMLMTEMDYVERRGEEVDSLPSLFREVWSVVHNLQHRQYEIFTRWFETTLFALLSTPREDWTDTEHPRCVFIESWSDVEVLVGVGSTIKPRVRFVIRADGAVDVSVVADHQDILRATRWMALALQIPGRTWTGRKASTRT
jgi:hypothetical protein